MRNHNFCIKTTLKKSNPLIKYINILILIFIVGYLYINIFNISLKNKLFSIYINYFSQDEKYNYISASKINIQNSENILNNLSYYSTSDEKNINTISKKIDKDLFKIDNNNINLKIHEYKYIERLSL